MRIRPKTWSDSSWTYNVFRVFEMMFGRKAGVRVEMTAEHDGSRVIYRAHTLEASCALVEQHIRAWLTKGWIPVKLTIPQFNIGSAAPLRLPFMFALAYDNSAIDTSTSFSFTVTGSSPVLAAFIHGTNPGSAFSASYNSVSMSALDFNFNLSPVQWGVQDFTLTSPATGTHTAAWGVTNASNSLWISLSGASGFQSNTTASGNAANNSLTISSATGNLCVDAAFQQSSNPGLSCDASQTQRQLSAGAAILSTKAGASSVTLKDNFTSNWIHLVFDVIVATVVPTVTTQAATHIHGQSATANGNITDIGSSTPDKRGVVYDTSSHADPGNTAPASSAYPSKVEEAGSFSTGAFTESLTGLSTQTTYYVRAYAHNSTGYAYGGEVSFTTGLIDYDNSAVVASGDNFTCTGSHGLLFVLVCDDAAGVTGVNYSGQPMTLVTSFGTTSYLYMMANPPTGANAIAFLGALGNNKGLAISYTGANVVLDSEASATVANTGTVTASPTVVASGCWLVGFANDFGAQANPITSTSTLRQGAYIPNSSFQNAIAVADSNDTVSTGAQSLTFNDAGASAIFSSVVVAIAPFAPFTNTADNLFENAI